MIHKRTNASAPSVDEIDAELIVMPEGLNISDFIASKAVDSAHAEMPWLEVWVSSLGRLKLKFHDTEYLLSESEKKRLCDFIMSHEVAR